MLKGVDFMNELGIRKTHDNLKNKLIDYIKAQYFAENDLLIDAADELLLKEGALYQEPYIEVSKNYKTMFDGFTDSFLDADRRQILSELTNAKLGVFSTPFQHQIKAIEEYYRGHDVIVTTGTGSGKTECFLWPILTDLIYEAHYNQASWNHEGIRALVLYPMNALVSDQLGRMRNIIGRKDDAFYKILAGNRDEIRRARFGMYTGRTSYAGLDDAKRNKELAKLIRENYISIEPSILNELVKIGRIPAKNLEAFVESLANGMQQTASEDTELFTRGEMQQICPDILITNYSMLEYMLMRPIEDGFWEKTVKWLNASVENKLMLVIDEAHMYRGASGGEVSLLIRRLQDRLGIDVTKLKCVLTSASVPKGQDDELKKFACALTGKDVEKATFQIVREELEKIDLFRKGSLKEANFFASILLANLQSTYENQKKEYQKISDAFSWGTVPHSIIDSRGWLYEHLKSNPLVRQVIKVCSEGGKAFSEIAKDIFEDDVPHDLAERALEILLQLGTMAKSRSNKVLLGSKVHMMFRGIMGIYACSNPDCPQGHSGMGVQLGYITDRSIEKCPYCQGRMFELMMDRKCGTLFFRVFVDRDAYNIHSFDFLWGRHNLIIKEPQEMHLWIMPKNRNDIFKLDKTKGKAKASSIIGYMDSQNGLLFRDESHKEKSGYLKVLLSELYYEEDKAYTFNTCPNCGRDHIKLTPFITRGNEPFANIVREQFESQIPKDFMLNNEGKKVLLFSDSRQRAATLARDMTIAADGDAGRQAIFLAQKLLDESHDTECTLDMLYYAFLKVVYDNKIAFFYGKEKETFDSHLNNYGTFSANKSEIRFGRVRARIGNPPEMFYQLLLKNISDNYRAFSNLGLGQVVLAEKGEAAEDLEDAVLGEIEIRTGLDEGDIRTIYNTWIQYLLVRKMALFSEVGDDVRNSILAFERGGFGIDEKPKLPKFLHNILIEHKVSDDVVEMLLEKFINLTECLQSIGRNHNRKYISGTWLQLKRAENADWFKCDRCAGMSLFTLWGHCVYCGSKEHLHAVDAGHLDRYSLWRRPVFDVLSGKKIRNITTEEHTAQLSYKDVRKDAWVTTEKYELAFRNIALDKNEQPVDVLSCTTTMEVGIDIGSLTSVGLRNVPPMRENYQQRAGRAGRAGAAVSSIVTYTENGPHDAWYFNHPNAIISGTPRKPWIDSQNDKLVRRHITLILLQEYFRKWQKGLDEINTIDFLQNNNASNYEDFLSWVKHNIPFNKSRENRLIPVLDFNWEYYACELECNICHVAEKVQKSPSIYTLPMEADVARSNLYNLMDVLFSEGMLPNYSFPRNIVHFWIEDLNGKVTESPERSIDIALSEYAPGRTLVVNKQTYISGGIFDYYSKFSANNNYKAAASWLALDEYNKKVLCCTNPLCGWFGVDQSHDICPLCGSTLNLHTMVKPWGFAAREGRNMPETHAEQEMSYASQPSYSSMPSGEAMREIGTSGYIRIENRENQKLVIINKGPENEGFELCEVCGAIEPSIGNASERNNRKRPYKLPYLKNDPMKCKHNYSTTYLGYEFNTDMMVLEIKLDDSKLDLVSSYAIWLIPALTTFAEALSLAASNELDVEYNDIKSGYRIRRTGTGLCADIYLYDSLSSGAGYANRVSELIDLVFDKMNDIFKGCDCSASCPRCLQNFWNQREKNNLDRLLGKDFLSFVRYGILKTAVDKHDEQEYFRQINHIAHMHGHDDIITTENDVSFLNTNTEKREIMVYPSMCNVSQVAEYNKICLSDRMCRFAMSEIWQQVNRFVGI